MTSPGGRTNLVARVDGPRDRPALVLLSHSDVVPVEEDRWTRDPFGGEIHDGSIWGRGALDMKGISVMHAVAAADLVRAGRTPDREIIVVVVADEEAGGDEGAQLGDEFDGAYARGSAMGFSEAVDQGRALLAQLRQPAP